MVDNQKKKWSQGENSRLMMDIYSIWGSANAATVSGMIPKMAHNVVDVVPLRMVMLMKVRTSGTWLNPPTAGWAPLPSAGSK